MFRYNSPIVPTLVSSTAASAFRMALSFSKSIFINKQITVCRQGIRSNQTISRSWKRYRRCEEKRLSWCGRQRANIAGWNALNCEGTCGDVAELGELEKSSRRRLHWPCPFCLWPVGYAVGLKVCVHPLRHANRSQFIVPGDEFNNLQTVTLRPIPIPAWLRWLLSCPGHVVASWA
jgi:hypothetical protein